MPEEDVWTLGRYITMTIFVLAPLTIGVSLAGIYNNYIKSKKYEESILRQDAERYHDGS
jgi:hypothetical protein